MLVVAVIQTNKKKLNLKIVCVIVAEGKNNYIYKDKIMIIKLCAKWKTI